MSRRADLLLGAGLALGAALLWFWLIPAYAGAGDQAMLPRIAAGAIGLLGLGMVGSRLGRSAAPAAGHDPFIELGGGEPWPILAFATAWVVFVVLLERLGFYLGGVAALLASLLLLGVRRPAALALWIGGTVVAVHLVFERLLALRLPRGTLEAAIGL